MPDKKLTDNEIKKAYELCFAEKGTKETCGKCPYHKFGKLCKVKRDRDALDLINRLQAENKRLSTLAKLGNTRANDYRVMRDRALKAEAEIERLEKEVEIKKQKRANMFEIASAFERGKTEAYKECIEKVKEQLRDIAKIDWQDNYYYLVGVAFFDNILKELTEKSN